MPRVLSPRGVLPLPTLQAHGVVHSARARRLVIAGQIGMRLDGFIPETLSGQCDIAWDNLLVVLADAGMSLTNLIRITVLVTVPGSASTIHAMRDRWLGGHRVVASYAEVGGLAHPEALVTIEAEAICEEPDLAFLEQEGQIANADPGGIAGPAYRGARE